MSLQKPKEVFEISSKKPDFIIMTNTGQRRIVTVKIQGCALLSPSNNCYQHFIFHFNSFYNVFFVTPSFMYTMHSDPIPLPTKSFFLFNSHSTFMPELGMLKLDRS